MPNETSSDLLSIKHFGPGEVQIGNRPLPQLRSRKGMWLLALLTLRHGSQVQRSWLAGTLWPDYDEAKAFHSLRQSLTDLRRALGPHAARLQSPSTHTLLLDLTGTHTDVLEFDALAARVDTDSLQRAIALYRGPLLEGCLEEWVLPERNAREAAYLQALEKLAAQSIARKDFASAIRFLQTVIFTDPLRESAQRTLMQALAQDGDFGAVVQVYRSLRLLLHRELNAEPDAATTSVFQQVRHEARRRTQPQAPPEHIEPRAISKLPHPITSMVGRKQEVEDVRILLTTSRLVTLTGPGGVGKTRLAISIAEEAADDFLDGAFFVDLSPLTDPGHITQAAATVLGLHEQVGHPLLSTLADFLKEKNALILLDNCEHMVEASAAFAYRLVTDCPRLRILATSRELLGNHRRGRMAGAASSRSGSVVLV